MGNGLGMPGLLDGGFDFPMGKIAVAVCVDDIVQPGFDRTLVRLINQPPVTSQFRGGQTTKSIEKVRQAVLGEIGVLDMIEALPFPGAVPGGYVVLFGQPAADELPLSVGQQVIESPPMGDMVRLGACGDLITSGQGIQAALSNNQVDANSFSRDMARHCAGAWTIRDQLADTRIHFEQGLRRWVCLLSYAHFRISLRMV